MRTLVCIVAGLAFSHAAFASPLDRSLVPADSAVTAHIDVEAFASSQLGRAVMQNRENFELDGLDSLKAFGIEPFRDFLGITLFMPSIDAEKPVVVVRATEAIDALWAHLKTEPHAKVMTTDGYEILSWEDKGDRKYGFVKPDGAVRLAFISDDWEPLVAALKTADKKSPSQKNGATPASGSFLFIDAAQLPSKMLRNDKEGPMAVVREVRSAVVDAGESGEDLFAIADVELSSERTASEVQQMVQGLVAFGRVALHNHAELSGMRGALDAFAAKTQGTRLVLSTKLKAADVVDAAKKLHDDGSGEDKKRIVKERKQVGG